MTNFFQFWGDTYTMQLFKTGIKEDYFYREDAVFYFFKKVNKMSVYLTWGTRTTKEVYPVSQLNILALIIDVNVGEPQRPVSPVKRFYCIIHHNI